MRTSRISIFIVFTLVLLILCPTLVKNVVDAGVQRDLLPDIASHRRIGAPRVVSQVWLAPRVGAQ